MKKILSLLALVMLSCMGAWADQFTIDISAGTIKNSGGTAVTTGWAAKWESTQTDPFQISIVAYNTNNEVVNDINAGSCTSTNFQIAAGQTRPGYFVISANKGYKIAHCSFTASAVSAGNTVNLSVDGNNYEVPPTTGKSYSFDCSGTAKIWMNTANQAINFTNIVLTLEDSKAQFVSTSTAAAPQYYTIQNVRTRDDADKNNRAYVTADAYGDGCLKQSNTTSVGSYWYFEDASADAGSVDLTVYQPVYIRSAKFGGYLTTDGTDNAAYTKTKSASEKQIYYLWKWDNAANPDGYLCISKTAAKTRNATGGGSRNSWADRNGGGAEINYYYSQDGGTHFAMQLAEKATVEELVKNYVLPTANAISDYVGDYSAESVPSMASAKDAYDVQQTSQTIDGLREAYTQEFVWSTAPARRTISADKYYVIESAKNRNIRICIDDYTNHKFRYAAIEDYQEPGIFRFTNKSTETSSNWGGSSQEYDTYKIYCVGSTQKGYMGWGTYNSQVSSANSSDAAVVKVVPVGSASTFQLAVYDATQNNGAGHNCTYSIGNAQTSVADNATGEIVSWNTYDGNNCNVWKIREVEAPTAPTQSVTITGARAATFYTGKELSIPSGVTAKILADDTAKDTGNGVYHLTYTALDGTIPAGTAVVLIGDAATYQFPRSLEPHDYVDTSAEASAENRLIGTLADNVEATGSGLTGTLYALGNQDAGVAFYHFLGETLTAGKAYLDASGLGVAGSSVRAFAIFDEEGTLTGMNLVETVGDNAEVFDLQGRRVQNAMNGLYIVNGKKVIR